MPILKAFETVRISFALHSHVVRIAYVPVRCLFLRSRTRWSRNGRHNGKELTDNRKVFAGKVLTFLFTN